MNVAIGAIQRSGLIAYRRGAITISDREGLEAVACECYRVVAETYEKTMEMECADGVRIV